ncbi:MAG: glycosyltransferase family 4 protein, partial [Kiritimatiellia bacterium]
MTPDASLRVVLGHDWLTGMRGGERVLELAASRYPAAPIMTLLCNHRAISRALNAHPIITSP